MKLKNIVLVIIIFVLSGCATGPATYAEFERNRNFNAYHVLNPNMNKEYREIYSEDKYIYKYEYPKGCHFGYLTNRDDKPEKVIGWVIISGKEFCKESPGFVEFI